MVLVPHCKERWRNLRACLTRHLKQQQYSADGSVFHKPYYLADHMKFLLPFTRSRTANSSIVFESTTIDFDSKLKAKKENGNVTKSAESEQTQKPPNDSTTYTISAGDSDDNQFVTFVHNAELTTETLDATHLEHIEDGSANDQKLIEPAYASSSTNLKTVQEIVYEQPEPKRIKISCQESDDADLNFFRSLLPDIRLMTASQKRRFKMGIFGLIDNVLTNSEVNS